MIFRIFDDRCNLFLDDEIYLEYKTKVFDPTDTDEDIKEYMVAQLQLFVHIAFNACSFFDGNRDRVNQEIMILNGDDEEKKQFIYDKCAEYLRDDIEMHEFVSGEAFNTMIDTLIKECDKAMEQDDG